MSQDLVTEQNAGSLFSLDHSGDVSQWQGGYNIANGLAWSLDHKLMYHAESFPGAVFVFDFNAAEGSVCK